MRNRNYLMQREKDLTKEERLRLIDIIAKVPENRLPYIVSLARFFFAEETQGTQKANRDKLLFGFLAKYDVLRVHRLETEIEKLKGIIQKLKSIINGITMTVIQKKQESEMEGI